MNIGTTKDMTRLEFIRWMLENNDCLSEQGNPYESTLVSTKPINKLHLPYGWTCSGNIITNKGKSSTGISHFVEIKFL